MAATAQSAPRATCHGFPVTIAKSSGTITGTPRRDVIRLTGPGTVRSLGGNDIICGSRFNDVIHAGLGNDVVVSGRGHDRIFGGPGNDNLFGEGGNDRLHGGPGRDVMAGGAGRNHYAPLRKGAKAQNGLAVQGDTIVRAVRTVSIVSGTADVNRLVCCGGGFGFAWQPPAIPQATSAMPVWATMQPSTTSWLSIPDQVAVYWGQQFGAEFGALIRPSQTGYTSFGRSWTLQPGRAGTPDLIPSATPYSGSTAGTVTVSATDVTPGPNPYLVGLAMVPAGSGGVRSDMAPAQAVGINPFMQIGLPQPQLLRVWAQPVELQMPGELVYADMPMQPSTVGRFTSAQPTAMLRYSAARGFTSG
ncbi:MAG: calcium-binding protein [Actinomycetota bacterium]|nr:calcium-binding protein [Actinomycetota bacterium]